MTGPDRTGRVVSLVSPDDDAGALGEVEVTMGGGRELDLPVITSGEVVAVK